MPDPAARKYGDPRPLRLTLDRDVTDHQPVTVRVGRAAGRPAVIDKQAVVENQTEGVIRVDLEPADVAALVPGEWLVEARPNDGSIHPSSAWLKLTVYAAITPKDPP